MASDHRFTKVHNEPPRGSAAEKVAKDLERLKKGRKGSLSKGAKSLHFSYDTFGKRETKCESSRKRRRVNRQGDFMVIYYFVVIFHQLYILYGKIKS